jgi:hypothetical protein
MGFDVRGPTRHVRASNVDDGEEPRYDVLAMPRAYGLHCPQLERLSQRFYESTTLRFAEGHVSALHDELVRLRQEYRARRVPELIAERNVHTFNPQTRDAIVEKLLRQDTVYRVLEEFQLLCDEAIAAQADVQCEGD